MIGLFDYSRLSVDERLEYARKLMLPSELAELSYDEDINVVIEVLKNPYVSFETMLRCSSDPDSRIRSVVAEGPYPTILRELAKDPCFNVCLCVANNNRTPALSLDLLSHYPSWYVRYSVAQNKSTLNQTLSCLMRDECEKVRSAAAKTIASKIIVRVD